jgi:tetratricopeptide (TPR) repeat protein
MSRTTKLILSLLILGGSIIYLRQFASSASDATNFVPVIPDLLRWLEKVGENRWVGTLADILGILSFVGGILLGIAEIMATAIRRQSDNPFLIIRDSSEIFPALGGINRVSLEKGAISIPYLKRGAGKSFAEQIHSKLFECNRLLLIGESGIGKTREMGEVAQLLIREGHTVVLLQTHGDPILRKLEYWPSGWPRNNLVILIDDLHLLFKQKVRTPSSPNESFWSKIIGSKAVPFEERFYDFLVSVENIVPDYKLIATVRSNSEGWELLSDQQRGRLWSKLSPETFQLPSFTPRETSSYLQLLVDTIPNTPIQEGQISVVSAKEKFGSPRNVIRNVMLAVSHNRNLGPDNYIPTLQGSLSTILQEAERRHPITKDLLGVIWYATRNRFPLTYSFVNALTIALRTTFIFSYEFQPVSKAIRHLIDRQVIKRNGELITIDDAILDLTGSNIEYKEFTKAVSRVSPFLFPVKYADVDAVTNYVALFYSSSNNFLFLFRMMAITIILGMRTAFNRSNEKNKELYDSIRRKIPILRRIQSISSTIFNVLYIVLYVYPRTIYISISKTNSSARQYLQENMIIIARRSIRRRKNILNRVALSDDEKKYEEEKIALAVRSIEQENIQVQAELAMDEGRFEDAEIALRSIMNESDFNAMSNFQKWNIYRSMGYALVFQAKWSEASSSFEKCLSQFDKKSQNAISPLIGKAYALSHLGKTTEAKEIIAQCLNQRGRRFIISWQDKIALVALDLAWGNREEAIKKLKAMRVNFDFAAVINKIAETKQARRFVSEKLSRPELIPGVNIYSKIQKHIIWYGLYFFLWASPYMAIMIILTTPGFQNQLMQDPFLEIIIVLSTILGIQIAIRKAKELFFDDKSTHIIIDNDRIVFEASYRKKITKTIIRFRDITDAVEDFHNPRTLTISSRNGASISIYPRQYQNNETLRDDFYAITAFRQVYPTLWDNSKWFFKYSSIIFLIYPTYLMAILLLVILVCGITLGIYYFPIDRKKRKYQIVEIVLLSIMFLLTFFTVFGS